MTPKQKAYELFERYNNFDFNTVDNRSQIQRAKECALIAVNEIISINPLGGSFDAEKNPHHYYSVKYWKEVKQEIEMANLPPNQNDKSNE